MTSAGLRPVLMTQLLGCLRHRLVMLERNPHLIGRSLYVFLTHSAGDKPFVRRLADSLVFYRLPMFFDERDIRVGDSIPDRVYRGLDRASHVVFVISSKSIGSHWVQEELSAAKMKQLSARGCVVLPVLLDDVDLPVSVQHIKYADFRQWRLDEAYFKGLHDLLIVFGIDQPFAASANAQFVLAHLRDLVAIKECADIGAAAYLDVELSTTGSRDAWQSPTKLRRKLWPIEPFSEALANIRNDLSSRQQRLDGVDRLLTLCRSFTDDRQALLLGEPPVAEVSMYPKMLQAENTARRLCRNCRFDC